MTRAARHVIVAAWLLATCLGPAQAHSIDPPVSWRLWVPADWTLLSHSEGDLDKDGRADVALVLERNDPALRKRNTEGLGPPDLNLNPRRLRVLLKTDAAYRVLGDFDGVLPSEHSEDNPCLDDPLDMGGVHIARGTLRITQRFWLSCGSGWVSQRTHAFRLEGGRLRLIGFDGWEFSRMSGERNETSVNFLTQQRKRVTGLNEFEPAKPRVSWEKLPPAQPVYLDQMVQRCKGDPPEDDSCF